MYYWIKRICLHDILEHVVVSDWMASACEHHRAETKAAVRKKPTIAAV